MGRLSKIAAVLRTSVYALWYYHCSLKERKVALFSASDSQKLSKIANELRENPAYRAHRVVWLRGKECEGPRGARHLASAKWLFCDGALPEWFAKRDGQCVACLAELPGDDNSNRDAQQCSYRNSDYLVCRDAAERDAIESKFQLENLYRGVYLISENARELCSRILLGERCCLEATATSNGRENVLFLSGYPCKNGVTTALLNLFAGLDLQRRNYYISFFATGYAHDSSYDERIPADVQIQSLTKARHKSLLEHAALRLYFQKNREWRWVLQFVARYFERLYRHNYANCDFSWTINFYGYNRYYMNMLLYGRHTGRAVYLHNEMIRELETRHNQHRPTLERVYRSFERVIPVTEDITSSAVKLSGRSDNIRVVNNCHDWQDVLRRAELPMCFDSDTLSNVSKDQLVQILEGDAIKMISIGRYSPEKGHERLLEAFARFHRERPDSFLIVIGGHGSLYQQTVARAAELGCADCTVLIHSMHNPMPVLKRCSLFVLSSLYEGLGLVILEADTLGIPVISTDVPGPRGFMREFGGTLVPSSAEGIYQGMKEFAAGKVRPMHVDYAAYNRRAIEQFEAIFAD